MPYRAQLAALALALAGAAPLPAQALKERFTLHDPQPPFACVALSPDGKLLAAGLRRYDRKLNKAAGVVRIWDTAGGQEQATLTGHTEWVWALAFSPDGKTLASWSQGSQGAVKVWDVTTWKEIREFKSPSLSRAFLAFSPDGKRLGFAGMREVAVWEVETRRELSSFSLPRRGGTAAFSPDLNTLAAADHQDVDLWDIPSGKQRGSFLDHRGSANPLGFVAGGKTLVVASTRLDESKNYHSEIKFWDVASGRERATLKGHAPWAGALAVSSDGKLLAVTGSKTPSGNQGLKVIGTSPERLLAEVSLAGIGRAYALTFSRDGRLLVAGTEKG